MQFPEEVVRFDQHLWRGEVDLALDLFNYMSTENRSMSCSTFLVKLSKANPPMEGGSTKRLVHRILESGWSIRLADEDNVSALQCSVKYSSHDFTAFLLELVPWTEETLNRSFLEACENGKHDTCKLIYNTGRVDLNARNNVFMTPLHVSIIRGDTNFVAWLLKEGAENFDSEFGRTNLLLSLRWSKDIQMVKLLLENGSDVYELSPQMKNTVAITAASNGDYAIFEYILSMGADPYIPNLCGATPLEAALTSFFFEPRIVHLLLDVGCDATALNKVMMTTPLEALFRVTDNANKVLRNPALLRRLMPGAPKNLVKLYLQCAEDAVAPTNLANLLRCFPEDGPPDPWEEFLKTGTKRGWKAFVGEKMAERAAFRAFHVRTLPADVSRHIKSFLFEKGALKLYLREQAAANFF
jgi:ankyrin repeat protein